MGPWSPEEDQKLLDSVARHGLGKWALVAIDLYPRTDNQCWRRWKTGRKDQLSAYRRTIKKKEQLLVKNFAGREKERPHHIDVEDLVDLSEEQDSEDEDDELEFSDDSEEFTAKNRKRKLSQRSTRVSKRRKTGKEKSEDEDESSDELTGDVSEHVTDSHSRKSTARSPAPAKTKAKPRSAPAKKGRKGSKVTDVTSESSEQVLVVDRDVLIDEQGEGTADSALPVVLPSPVTLRAAFKLLTTLDQTARPESAADERNLDLVLDHVDSPDFRLLAAWFNSLFLYPTLIAKDLGFIASPGSVPGTSSTNEINNNWNINNLK